MLQYTGGSVSLQQAVNDLQHRLSRLENHGAALPASWATGFRVQAAPSLDGAQISFELLDGTGIEQAAILRNFSLDPKSATVLQSYPVRALTPGNTVTYSDNDPALAGKEAHYWLQASPLNPALAPALLGPQSLQAAAADQVPPDALLNFDASVSAGPGTSTVTVGVSFQPPNETRFGSCRVLIKGYNGNASYVAIGQFTSDPDNLTLQKTGETVTLAGLSVNKAGIAAAQGTALTIPITLGASTVPCALYQAAATALATGVQVGFPAGPEASITKYIISRGPLGGGFAAASQIGTVTPTGAAAYTYLDSSGLTGQFEWYVQAQNSIGTSLASPPVTLQAVTSSANLPANVPFNTTNFATVDSIDAGSSATARIYGPGGVGTSWERATGYGQETLPAGEVSGLAHSTGYFILWNGSAYFAVTAFAQALGDNDVWAGSLTTCAAGGSGGTTGGGGSSGGGANGRLQPTL